MYIDDKNINAGKRVSYKIVFSPQAEHIRRLLGCWQCLFELDNKHLFCEFFQMCTTFYNKKVKINRGRSSRFCLMDVNLKPVRQAVTLLIFPSTVGSRSFLAPKFKQTGLIREEAHLSSIYL